MIASRPALLVHDSMLQSLARHKDCVFAAMSGNESCHQSQLSKRANPVPWHLCGGCIHQIFGDKEAHGIAAHGLRVVSPSALNFSDSLLDSVNDPINVFLAKAADCEVALNKARTYRQPTNTIVNNYLRIGMPVF